MAFADNTTKNRNGRPPGSQNKVGAQLKEDLMDAYNQLGGSNWLMQMGLEYPKEFMVMMSKLLPKEINSDVTVTTNPADELTRLRELAENARNRK